MSISPPAIRATAGTPAARTGPPPGTPTARALGGHGLAGRVLAVDDDRLVIRDRPRRLREVRVGDRTVVREQGKRIDRRQLAPGDRVAVVGAPGRDGVLVARGIVVAPGPARTPTPR